MNLNEVRAAITGGASGLGLAVAELLSTQGGRVTLLDIQQEQGQKAAQALGAAAGFRVCDVSSESSVDAAMQAAAAAMGGLNVVVEHLFIEDRYNDYDSAVKQACRLLESFHRVLDANPGRAARWPGGQRRG